MRASEFFWTKLGESFLSHIEVLFSLSVDGRSLLCRKIKRDGILFSDRNGRLLFCGKCLAHFNTILEDTYWIFDLFGNFDTPKSTHLSSILSPGSYLLHSSVFKIEIRKTCSSLADIHTTVYAAHSTSRVHDRAESTPCSHQTYEYKVWLSRSLSSGTGNQTSSLL